jgi:hypothetical protein
VLTGIYPPKNDHCKICAGDFDVLLERRQKGSKRERKTERQ